MVLRVRVFPLRRQGIIGRLRLRLKMRTAARILVKHYKQRYTRNSFGGGEWASLQTSTIQRKGHSRILVETGRLQRSITSRRRRDGFDIGIFDRRRHPGGGGRTSVRRLARLHETGRSTVNTLGRRKRWIIISKQIPSSIKRRIQSLIGRDFFVLYMGGR